jgi:hypothetical protein
MKRRLFRASILTAALAGTIALGCAGALGADDSASAQGTLGKKTNTMKIRIKVGDTTLTGTLEDNATSRDFVSLLPLKLTLKNYGATEKISDLPGRLSTKGAPAGCDPDVGDITYYAPWGNLAIFRKDFRYSDGLIRLGKIEGAIAALDRSEELEATIELAEPAE